MPPPSHHRLSPRGERILARTPAALIEYPLELLLSIWGLFTGLPLVFGISPAPNSVSATVVGPVVWLWGLGLTLSALSIAVGIRRPARRWAIGRGLWLMGPVCFCYALALAGRPGGLWIASFLALVIAPFCGWRGWWLRQEPAIQERIRQAARW